MKIRNVPFGRIWGAYLAPYRGLPKLAWIISLGVLVNRIGSSVVYFLALYLNQELGRDAIESGWALSLWGAGSVIGSFAGGWFCDNLGPRRVLIWGHFISGIIYLSFLFTRDYQIISALAFLVGIADFSLRPTIAVALIGATDSATRARSNALRRLALNTGVGIGAALGGFLFAYDPTYLFWLDGLTSLAAGIIFWRLMASEASQIEDKQHSKPIPLRVRPWHDRVFMLILLSDTIVSFITAQTKNAFPLYLTSHYKLDAIYFGFLLSINSLIIVLFELPLVHHLRRFPMSRLCALGALCYGLGFGLLPIGTLSFWVWFCWITFTLGEMLTSPASMAMTQERASRSASPGAYMGLFTASYSIMGFIGPSVGGLLYEKTGGTYLWALCLLAGIASSYLFHRVGKYAAS